MKEYSWKNKIYILISCLFFIILWQVAAIIINNDIYIPRIEQVFRSIIEIFAQANFKKVVLSSFARTFLSYILALALAITLGVLSIVYPFFKYALAPLNSFIKTIPTMVLIVLALVWFNKDLAPFVVGFSIAFPILYEGIRNSLMKIDEKLLDMTRIYEVSLLDKVKKIYIPVIKFHIINIFVSTFSLTFKVVIAGEVHGQPKYGIGSQIQLEKVNFNTPAIFGWITIIVFLSLIFEAVNIYLNKKIYRWHK